MALKATICKVSVSISDMDRHYYQNHQLTLAQHPSETTERLMARLLVWILHASERLEFTRGLSATDEPDLWERDDTGQIQHWLELGHPDEKRLKKASSLAQRVTICSYQGRVSTQWWETHRLPISSLSNISVLHLPQSAMEALPGFYNRTMDIQIIPM